MANSEEVFSAGLNGLGDLTQMDLHASRIAKGQDPGSSRAPLGADAAKEMGPCGALILGCARAGSAPRPTPGQLVLLADANFTLEPNLDRRALRQDLADLRHTVGEAFLNPKYFVSRHIVAHQNSTR